MANTKPSAAQVTYTTSGAGAVITDVQTKLRQFVSVKDFGAVGDGVTDDVVAIQKAIDSLGTSGGFVYVPSGVYMLSWQVLMKDKIHLIGTGTLKATLSPTFKPGTNTSHFSILQAYEVDDWSIEGITIDTSLVTSLPSGAFSLRGFLAYRCSNFKIRNNVWNVNGGATAILGCDTFWIEGNRAFVNAMTGTTDAVYDHWSQGSPMWSAFISNNYADGNGVARWGVLVNGIDDGTIRNWTIKDLIVADNIIKNCTLDGIWLGGREPRIERFTVVGNVISDCRKGISLSSCIQGVVSENVISNCYSRGIDLFKEGSYPGEISCKYVQVKNNSITNYLTTPVGSVFELASDCNNNTVIDNIVKDANYQYLLIAGGNTEKNYFDLGVYDSADLVVDTGGKNINTGRPYTPTLTPVSNVTSATLDTASYYVDGTYVTCFVKCSAVAPVVGSYSVFSISLPTLYRVGNIIGTATNVRCPSAVTFTTSTADVAYFPTVTTSITFTVCFHYRISF